MLEHFVEKNIDTTLIFPKRGKDNINKSNIINYYNIINIFSIRTYNHFLPFNRIQLFEQFNFLISSFIWSAFASIKTSLSLNIKDVVMTRTHWILYFISKNKNFIIYECHKFSKIDNFVFKRLKYKNNVVIIFSNESLKKEFMLSDCLENNSLVLNSSYDERQFKDDETKKKSKQVVFVGSLLRFNKSRNIKFLIKAFSDFRLEEFELVIVGGPADVVNSLKLEVSSNNIKFTGPLPQKEAIDVILKSEIGILINDNNTHSVMHTSPIKYFEYLRGGLKILAVDYPAHRNLPLNENCYYFEEGNFEDFINKLISLYNINFKFNKKIKNFSYKRRVEILINHMARLEGVEPPTL